MPFRICSLVVAALLAFANSALSGIDRPNIILILTDDQGYGDLSCHGNPVLKTPHLDQLSSEGVRFTNFHVSPTCAPTRAALLTGRHEFKSGVTHTINERERLSLSAQTFSQLLKKEGYQTGIFGKWHLGDEDDYQPDRRGFDEVFIHGAGGIGQSFPGSCGDAPGNKYFDPAIWHNGKFEKTKGYCTDVFFNRATDWIEDVKDRGPFYCHIATNAPHAPLDCPKEYEAIYSGKVTPNQAKFFGMIANIDDNVGRLMAKLREWKIEENTLVIFVTDNGGTEGVPVFNAGMRGSKVTPWVGGARVPSIWRWKNKFTPAEISALTAHIDVFPTLMEIAQTKLDAANAARLDGRSLLPLLNDSRAPWEDRCLVTHVGRWERGQASSAKFKNCSIRNTRFQMVSLSKNQQASWQLFDLENDPSEKDDVIAKFPEVAAQLARKYDDWWESVQPDLVNENAVGPKINPFKERYWRQFPGEKAAK